MSLCHSLYHIIATDGYPVDAYSPYERHFANVFGISVKFSHNFCTEWNDNLRIGKTACIFLGPDRVSKCVKQSSDVWPFVWQLFGQTCFGFCSLFWYFIKQFTFAKQSILCQTISLLESQLQYRAKKKSMYVIWWSLFLLLLNTSASLCPQRSCNHIQGLLLSSVLREGW